MRRFAGATMIAGSLLFVIGGLTLPIPHYFGTSDPMLGLQYIEESPAAWDLGNAMFGAGGLIAAIGLVLLARSVHRVTSGRILAVTAYVAATLATAGAMLWVIIKAHGLAFREMMLSHIISSGFRHPNRTFFFYDQVRSAAVHGEEPRPGPGGRRRALNGHCVTHGATTWRWHLTAGCPAAEGPALPG
jgi:hypothetical protein